MKMLQKFLTSIWQFNRWIPLVLGGLLGVNLILYAYLGYQVEPELEQKERSYIELQNRARKARQVESSELEPRQVFRRGQADLAKFLERVPARKDLSALIGELFSFAREAGLNIRAINYQPETLKDQDLLEYALSFSLAGDYEQVKEFIHLVEQTGRLVAIDNLKLNRGDKDKGQVRLSIQMTTYFRMGAA